MGQVSYLVDESKYMVGRVGGLQNIEPDPEPRMGFR